MSAKLTFFIALTLIVSAPAGAQQDRERGRKEPWEWTDEERAAVRFDRASIAERNAAYEASDPRSHRVDVSSAEKNGSVSSVIDGKRNPELLFPHELFDMLLGGIDPSESTRVKARKQLDPGIHSLGLNEAEFWDRIDTAAHEYIAAQVAGHSGPHEAGSRCALHKALELSESLIGRDRLYRVLYIVVAPGMRQSESTNFPDPAKELLRQAKGCEQ
jgi:hypothetical protein